MLWRSIDRVVISQPAHAWLAGQLARAWGNATFAPPDPYEEVCLGAEQHDIGWLEWEQAPTLNPVTGRPHMFREVTVAVHVPLWERGVELAMAFGRYPALLTSLHGCGLYATFDPARGAPGDAALVRGFLAAQTRVQERLIAELAADPACRDAARPERVAANRLLVAMVDRLSLALCGGVTAPVVVGTPGMVDVVLQPVEGDPRRLAVQPWPFRREAVRLVCEGRGLPDRHRDEATMRAALAASPAVTIVTDLMPG